MTILLSCPSKTFLIGEYLALFGGPALIATTMPHFELACSPQKNSEMSIQGIPLQSPAGKLLAEHPSFLKNFHIEFRDPHHQKGGLGASSAQFLLCYTLLKSANKLPAEAEFQKRFIENIDIEALHAEYLRLAWDGQGIAPSGYDVISQYLGHIAYMAKPKYEDHFHYSTLNWPFKDIEFLLLRTNYKVATHTHLNTLSTFAVDELQTIVHTAYQAMCTLNSHHFIDAIKQYAQVLTRFNFVAPSTQKLLKHLNNHLELLAAKGCGALGADVILILFNKEKSELINHWLQKENFDIIASSQNVTQGLKIERHSL